MKIKSNNSNFEPCPEYTGRAVCVDCTPLKKQQSQFGERDVFKVVFETTIEREDGTAAEGSVLLGQAVAGTGAGAASVTDTLTLR